ncbi:class I SAM-dependent methyltransferase [Echinicola rosea]|uniref:Methyltransferase n=1 Tax=Echinicola rosea TaxID=1807691 RepID=A0ABQ1V057_9BACT|nr:class I SAM-dependent methyltransferase [Echinicola rosea]GGF32060.1 putative methyltransferase [Echinicola rosea]
MDTSTVTACKLCGNTKQNHVHEAREMMFGTRDKFYYLECGACHSLQICTIPDNLGEYYPSDYYSLGEINFSTWPVRFIKKLRYSLYRLTKMGIFKHYHYGDWLENLALPLNSKILDLGCGNGQLLYEFYACGYVNLTGADPFMKRSIQVNPHIHLVKKSVFELEDTFDCIMMHHSFEHMDHPAATIQKTVELLNPNGKLLIRIPVAQKAAWQKYGMDWIQVDAPRHLFIHSEASMLNLAENAGLKLDKIIYDSTAFQFTGSELYQRNIPFLESRKKAHFSAQEIKRFENQAQLLNDQKEGDQACFYFSKR